MLNGFANDNVGRNRFMSRTKRMSDNFANAIGSTTANKECKYVYEVVGYDSNGTAISQKKLVCTTPTAKFDGGFANAIGSTNTSKECKYVNEIVGYYPSGHPIVERKLVCSSPTAKFDGGFANAIGKTPTTFNPIGYTPQKCGSGNNCPKGTYCLTNATNVATGETANWCVPFEQSSKFDGGFANAIGSKGKKKLKFDGGFENANGDCGCGCKGKGTCKDDLLDFSNADGAGGDCCVGKVCPKGSLCQTWYTQTTPTMRMKHCGCRFEDMRNK